MAFAFPKKHSAIAGARTGLRIAAAMAALAGAGLSTPLLAAGSGGDRVVLDRETTVNGHLYLSSTRFQNPDNCASAAIMAVPSTTPGFDVYVSIAMTAVASGKPVSIWVSGCVGAPWYASIPEISSLSIDHN